MHTGFYKIREKNKCETFDFMEDAGKHFPQFGDKNDLTIYLHGACDVFACMLRKKFGYPAYAIYAPGTDGAICFAHAFCEIVHNEKRYFIDARGITDSAEEFAEEYEDWFTADDILYKNYDSESYIIELGTNINYDIFDDKEVNDYIKNQLHQMFNNDEIKAIYDIVKA